MNLYQLFIRKSGHMTRTHVLAADIRVSGRKIELLDSDGHVSASFGGPGLQCALKVPDRAKAEFLSAIARGHPGVELEHVSS
jgi:hypothetical protein